LFELVEFYDHIRKGVHEAALQFGEEIPRIHRHGPWSRLILSEAVGLKQEDFARASRAI
jgi:hypothetical protein